MYQRLVSERLRDLAGRYPAVVVLGARHAGKTTLARSAFSDRSWIDCEDPATAAALREDPRFVIERREQNGLVIDEAQAVEGVFAAVRGLVDAARYRNGRFVILASAEPTLVRGAAESLAGRAVVVELSPLAACEASTGEHPLDWRTLWLKGGFPGALAGDHRKWWEGYLRAYLERDLAQYGVAADPVLARRLLAMLAHAQGDLLNSSQLGAALGVSYHTVQRYLSAFEQTFLLRVLRPAFRNVGKRLVKAPKVYLRDTGLLHHLLDISTPEQLAAHPARAASWETFVLEDLLRREAVAHPDSRASFWRTAAGAEIDLVLDRGERRVAVEVCVSGAARPRVIRGIEAGLADVDAAEGWIIDPGVGIERVSARVARAGFEAVSEGTPG